MHFHFRINGLLFYIMRYFLSEYCEKCQLKKEDNNEQLSVLLSSFYFKNYSCLISPRILITYI